MAQNLGDNVTIYDYYAKNGYTSGYVNGGGETQFTSYTLIANQSMTLTGRLRALSDDSTLPAVPVFQAPKIIINNTGSIGILIRSDNPNNKITFNDSSVNFDNAIYNGNNAANRIGPISFTGTSSINITSNTNGKTIIKASTLTGTVTLDVDEGVQDGDTFLIEATDNQLVITDGEWSATASTSGNVTTYTLAKSEPVPVAGEGYFKKLLRKKLALMMSNLKKKRPYYCEVEYLETTEQQDDSQSKLDASWIDTGIIPTSSSKMECRVQFTTLISGTNKEALFGTTNTSGNPRFAFGFASLSPYLNFYVGLGAQNLTTSVVRDTNAHIFKIDALNNSWSIDETTGNFTSAGTLSNTSSIYLFARHASVQGANRPANAKVYYCKIWDNGTLVRDLIPVLDWDYVPCMYDKVTGQLFYNAGTGTFSYGREIHYVDYIQTIYSEDSKSFIDTGYYPNLNTKVEFMASGINADSFAASSSGTWFTGGRQAYQQKMFGSHYNPSNQNLYFSFSTSQNSSYYSSSSMYGDNKKFTLDKTGLYINDVKIINNTNTTDFTSPATLAIFALNNNGTVISFTGYKLQYYKIWDNNTLVRDYVSAIDENGVGFMFDRVSHTIYDNAGTGAFGYSAREVEYLESSGTQYIDTGTTINTSTDEVVSDFQLISTTLYQWIMGEHDNGARFGIGVGDGTNKRNIAYGSTTYKVQDAQVYNEKHNFKANSNGVFLNDVQIHGYENFASVSTVYLFKLNLSGSNGAAGKIWHYKHKRNGTLVRDFIPCYKDGVLGMWDKSNEVFYPNAGTGTFTTGKIVEPKYE